MQGALDAEGTSVKEVLPWVDVGVTEFQEKNNCLEMYLRQSGERLLHFGSLLQGIVVVKTKLVEPRSAESKIFSLWFQLQSECSVM